MKTRLKHLIHAVEGRFRPDLVLKGGRVLNVFSGEVGRIDVAVWKGFIVGLGDYDADRVIDATSKFILPGFIDSHMHIESSLLIPAEYARAALLHGTTTAVADPHEIANVLGKRGIRYMLEASEGLPFDFYFMLPSCVPASTLDTSGAALSASDLAVFMRHRRVIGLAEVMSYPEVLAAKPDMLAKLELFRGMVIDGHAPGLTGKDLAAYVCAGPSSDHECTSADEAREKLGLGMTVYVREGSAAKNLDALLPAVTPENSRFFCFATDDLFPEDLRMGGINRIIKKAVERGLDPVTAVRMATINPAVRFGLGGKGAIAPGYDADVAVVDNLRDFSVSMVLKKGRVVVKDGKVVVPVRAPRLTYASNTIKTATIRLRDFEVEAETDMVRVIGLIPDQIETEELIMPAPIKGGRICPDIERDILKLAVVERHHKTGNIGIGLVTGFGLKSGCLASSVSHDSHNIIAVGVSDEDIYRAVMEIIKMKGGMVVADRGRVVSRLPLPVAGLMSYNGIEFVVGSLTELEQAARSRGVITEHPFGVLSFLALPVVPKLRLTDKGLVDATTAERKGLFV